MPNPWDSSIIIPESVSYEPYQSWLQLTRTLKDYYRLVDTLYGIPSSWLEWVERETKNRVFSRSRIIKPLPYRLGTLLNGIISLQESKFVCDTIENALRRSFIDHANAQSLIYSDFINTIPQFSKGARQSVEMNSAVAPSFLEQLSFYQLTETMARNWKTILTSPKPKLGFRIHFWSTVQCRDKNLFRKDMSFVREVRNTIAHCRRLMNANETQELYERVQLWLQPLNVELRNRVIAYRSRRPMFLSQLSW